MGLRVKRGAEVCVWLRASVCAWAEEWSAFYRVFSLYPTCTLFSHLTFFSASTRRWRQGGCPPRCTVVRVVGWPYSPLALPCGALLRVVFFPKKFKFGGDVGLDSASACGPPCSLPLPTSVFVGLWSSASLATGDSAALRLRFCAKFGPGILIFRL